MAKKRKVSKWKKVVSVVLSKGEVEKLERQRKVFAARNLGETIKKLLANAGVFKNL